MQALAEKQVLPITTHSFRQQPTDIKDEGFITPSAIELRKAKRIRPGFLFAESIRESAHCASTSLKQGFTIPALRVWRWFAAVLHLITNEPTCSSCITHIALDHALSQFQTRDRRFPGCENPLPTWTIVFFALNHL